MIDIPEFIWEQALAECESEEEALERMLVAIELLNDEKEVEIEGN